MEPQRPEFERISKRSLLKRVTVGQVCWVLGIEADQVAGWGILVPRLESQYLRESRMGEVRADRRRMRKDAAVAWAGGLRPLAHWLDGRLAVGEWLGEYHSLLVEYASRGGLRCESINPGPGPGRAGSG